MFGLFSSTPKEFEKAAEDIYKMVKAKEPESREHYRIGYTDDGRTSLTLLDSGGISMTLFLTQNGCEQLIKMLRATYPIQETPSEQR